MTRSERLSTPDTSRSVPGGRSTENPKVLAELAARLCHEGDPAAMIAHYEATLDVAPEEIHASFAAALLKIGQVDRSIAHYRKALCLRPSDGRTLNQLASVLEKHGEIEDAISTREEAIALDPENRNGYHRLARLLLKQGRAEDAIAVYLKLEELHPEAPEVAMSIGSVYKATGNFVKAEQYFQKVRTIAPTHVGALDSLTEIIKPESLEDTRIKEMETLLGSDDLTSGERVTLEFSLGRVLEEVGAFNDAIAHIGVANTLRRREVPPYDHEEIELFVENSMLAFDNAFFETVFEPVHREERPIFIVGMPRSGTTLIEQIISSHSEVFGAGELIDIHFLVEQLKGQASFDGRPYPQCIESYGAARFSEIGATYLRSVRRRFGSYRCFTDKLPHNFLHLGLIRTALPNAKVIHCRRHPLDTCLSIYKNNFANYHNYAYDQVEIARHYRAYNRLMAHWHKVLPGYLCEIEYESLIARPEEEMRRLLTFCELEWEPACLEFYTTERVVNTMSKNQVREPLHARSVQLWRNYEPHLKPLIEALEDGGQCNRHY